MKRRSFPAAHRRLITALLAVSLFLTLSGCDGVLDVISIVAPDSILTGKVAIVNVHVTASGSGSQSGYPTLGVVLQIPEGTRVLRAHYQHDSGGVSGELTPNDTITTGYAAEQGYHLFGGIASSDTGGNYTVTVWLSVPDSVLPGEYFIKAVTGEYRYSTWIPQNPKSNGVPVLDFSQIAGAYVSNPVTITQGPVDTTPPADVAAVVTKEYGSFKIDISAYDEEGQGDFVGYRIYVSKTPFTSTANAIPADGGTGYCSNGYGYCYVNGDIGLRLYYLERPPGTSYPIALNGLYYNTAYYFAVTALDVSGNESAPHVITLTIEAGGISGRVVDAGGLGIQGLWVEVYDTGQNWIANVLTDGEGNYDVSPLPAGTYKIFFNGSQRGFTGEWFNDKADFYNADALDVTPRNVTTSVDASLEWGGSVSGRATDSGGIGIEGIWVEVYGNDYYSPISSASTDADGSYTVTGLPTGNYRVHFYGSHLGYADEWFNDKTAFSDAEILAVTAPNETTNIDAALILTGGISGRVTDQGGAGISYVWIDVFDKYSRNVAYAFTDENGNYAISSLSPGEYKIQFSRYYYLSEWYNDKADFAAADPVNLAEGVIAVGVDAVLTAIPNIYVYPPTHYFETVNVGSYSRGQAFEIWNNGANGLVIGGITLSGANPSEFVIEEDTCSGQTLGQSGSCSVLVFFSPATAGAKNAVLSVQSDDPDTPVLDITLFGEGTLLPVFYDVPEDSMFEDYINTVFYNGITAGCTSNPRNYCPNDLATRASTALFLVKASGVAPSWAACNAYFDDLTSSYCGFAPYINWWYEYGITSGCGVRQFCPGGAVTRAELAYFTIATTGVPASSAPCNAYFSDICSNPFAPYINKVYELGISSGCGGGQYCPNNSANRSELAVFVAAGFRLR